MKENSYNTNIVLVCGDNQRTIENLPMVPGIGETLQYNGIPYLVNNVIYHCKEGFAPYIELKVTDISTI